MSRVLPVATVLARELGARFSRDLREEESRLVHVIIVTPAAGI